MRSGQRWIETPEAKEARIGKMKAAWAAKKAAGWKHPGFKNDKNGTVEHVAPPEAETVKETAKAAAPPASTLLRLITTATQALAEVDSIAVIEIEQALPSVTECARVKLALEHLVEKSERLLSLVSHCNGLLVARRDRIEAH